MHSVSVLYSRKRNVKIKTVAHLTDSPFEAVRICQGCYRCWETVPLNDCEGVERVM